MSRQIARNSAVAALVGLGLVAAATAPLTIQPSSHDFGDVALRATVYEDFDAVLASGTPQGTTLTWSIAGPDAAEFFIESSNGRGGTAAGTRTYNVATGGCANGPQGMVCPVEVVFSPKSLGPKQARLVVTDSRGNTAMAQLTGKGVAAICKSLVVFCNYAHLYIGTFGWTSALNGPKSQYKESVQVDVTNGVAVCNGSATSTFEGQSRTGAITGKGLIAVEWLDDPMYPWVYRITAACPTPDWPAGPNGEPATPSERAELGHNDRSSDKQSDPAIRPGMTLEQAIARLARLQGTLSYPAPETDQLNGVSGAVVVSWNLVRW